jgi:hypothetical protein
MNLYRITDVTLVSVLTNKKITQLSESYPGFTVDSVRKSEKKHKQNLIGKIVPVDYNSFAGDQIRNYIYKQIGPTIIMNIKSLRYEEIGTIDNLRQRVINHIPDKEIVELANRYLPKHS